MDKQTNEEEKSNERQEDDGDETTGFEPQVSILLNMYTVKPRLFGSQNDYTYIKMIIYPDIRLSGQSAW